MPTDVPVTGEPTHIDVKVPHLTLHLKDLRVILSVDRFSMMVSQVLPVTVTHLPVGKRHSGSRTIRTTRVSP